MKLFEVFEQPVEYRKHQQTDKWRQTYSFDVGERWYQVLFFKTDINDDTAQMYFKYGPNLPENVELYHVDLTLVGRGGGTGITGTGNAYTVFATVNNIIKDFRERNPSALLLITSKTSQPSRVKLYSRMLDKVAKYKWEVPEQRVPNSVDILTAEIAWLI